MSKNCKSQIMGIENRRRELEETVKKADLKDKEQKRQLDSLMRVLSDSKEMVKIYLGQNESYFFQAERREAEKREKFDKFMAEREKIEQEKDELIAEKENLGRKRQVLSRIPKNDPRK